MQPEPGHHHRSAVLVIARMRCPLQFRRDIYSTPEVSVVIRFDNVFATVGQPSIAQQKAIAAEREIELMQTRNPVCDEGGSYLVVRPPPPLQPPIRAGLLCLVNLGVSKTLILAFIPPHPSKDTHRLGNLLLCVQPKPIFD